MIDIYSTITQARGKTDLMGLFSYWNSLLCKRTWLVGERISLADVALATR